MGWVMLGRLLASMQVHRWSTTSSVAKFAPLLPLHSATCTPGFGICHRQAHRSIYVAATMFKAPAMQHHITQSTDLEIAVDSCCQCLGRSAGVDEAALVRVATCGPRPHRLQQVSCLSLC
jgi:hypothetical protein